MFLCVISHQGFSGFLQSLPLVRPHLPQSLAAGGVLTERVDFRGHCAVCRRTSPFCPDAIEAELLCFRFGTCPSTPGTPTPGQELENHPFSGSRMGAQVTPAMASCPGAGKSLQCKFGLVHGRCQRLQRIPQMPFRHHAGIPVVACFHLHSSGQGAHVFAWHMKKLIPTFRNPQKSECLLLQLIILHGESCGL